MRYRTIYRKALQHCKGNWKEARKKVAYFHGTMFPVSAYSAYEKDGDNETVCIAGYQILDTSTYNECFARY